ncbi:MAG: phosphate ABC transporter permease PstA [Victivallaceae bacterium]|nr:phosphate ABC transporter permease PstA [Victivallaceae bacterium]
MKKRGLFRRKIKDRAVRMFSGLAVVVAVGAMLWILYTVAAYGMASLNWEFFINPSKPYGAVGGGIANAIIGTVFITFGAAVIAVPPALLAGVYLSEYKDHRRTVACMRFSANVMMGMPSVLVGLFVYMILVVPTGNFSGFAASIALAIIMFPVIMRTTEDMLAMVPYSLRESALALGTTRARTTLHIVCKSARRGLITGVLLSLSRVSGETAPLLFTAMFADSWPTGYFTDPTANLPVLITQYATDSPFESMHRMGWGAALVVTLLVLCINVGTRIAFREKKYGN